jgi:uncharacterized iron-regulated protein
VIKHKQLGTAHLSALALVASLLCAVPTVAQSPLKAAPCLTVPAVISGVVGLAVHMHPDLRASTGCDTAHDAMLAAIETTLLNGGIVFLGEVHDNPRHHAVRAEILAALGPETNKAPSVLEHIRADQVAAITPKPPTTDALFTALKWDESGWPDKTMFAPLFQQVLGRPIFAGEPERGRVRDVARQGLKALPDGEAIRLKLDQPLPDAQQDALLTELEASHCGLMPKTAFGTMAVAQRYRDAFMADAAMTAATQHGSAIIFTGNGHARRDRGAPLALKQRGFDKPVLVVLFTESPAVTVDPAVADIIVSTPPATRKDPCEDMRARFGKKG